MGSPQAPGTSPPRNRVECTAGPQPPWGVSSTLTCYCTRLVEVQVVSGAIHRCREPAAPGVGRSQSCTRVAAVSTLTARPASRPPPRPRRPPAEPAVWLRAGCCLVPRGRGISARGPFGLASLGQQGVLRSVTPQRVTTRVSTWSQLSAVPCRGTDGCRASLGGVPGRVRS